MSSGFKRNAFLLTLGLSSALVLGCGVSSTWSDGHRLKRGSNGDWENDEDKVAICHVPPGNPENAHVITIGESAVDAHLRNHDGDFVCPYEGECDCPKECPRKDHKDCEHSKRDHRDDCDKDECGYDKCENEEKVSICHFPPGNPENAHVITIGESAVDAHLRNHDGDFVCPDKGECVCPPRDKDPCPKPHPE